MNQKVLVSIILIVLAIILVGIVGYFTLIKKPTPPFTTKETLPTSTPTKETLPTSPTPQIISSTPTLNKVRSYDLKFNYDMIDIGLSKNGKYGYVVFKKDNKKYIQINNQTYGPDDANFTIVKDNKAYIIYVKNNKMIIEQID